MLSTALVNATMPAADLDRARRFYEEKLGFVPADVQPSGVRYEAGGGVRFLVFPSSGRASGSHTQIGFQVKDIAAEVAALRSRGVEFETYQMPEFDPKTMIATFPTVRSAWFKDSEGNLIGIVELPA
jgi:catechol 2,3-dioxygenase-like lactoylglutathione lyase family enzyme